MRHRTFRILAMCLLSLVFAACDDNDLSLDLHTTRTVMIYMAAENSLSTYAHADIAEMKEGARHIPVNGRLLIYLDDRRGAPRIYEISAATCDTVRLYTYPARVCSAERENFAEALGRMRSLAPADEYGLVVWSHASGWLPGKHSQHTVSRSVLEDANYNTGGVCRMDIADFVDVLAAEEPLSFIFFDACLMMEIEAVYAMRNVAEYIVGSPAEIPAKGADYGRVMRHFFTCPFNPAALVQEYYATECDYWQQYHGERGGGIVISAVRTSELEALAEATRRLVEGSGLVLTQAQRYWIFSTDEFDASSRSFPDNYDMLSAMQQFRDREHYDAWLSQLWRTIVCFKATSYWDSVCDGFPYWGGSSMYSGYHGVIVDHSIICGLGLFIPQNKYTQWGKTWNADIVATEWYQAAM